MSYLKASKMYKMLVDACLDDRIDRNELDLLFVQANHHKTNMEFSTFLNLISRISLMLFPGPPHSALQAILENHFLPLYVEITQERHKSDEIQVDVIIEKLFKNVAPILHQIYCMYFQQETKDSVTDALKITQKSEKDLFKFLREFEICPAIINKSKIYAIWTQITEKSISGKTPIYWETAIAISEGGKLEGKIFTFGFFLDLIVLISRQSYCEDSNVQLGEGVCLLFERMELSKGFTNFQHHTNRPHTAKNSLMPTKQMHRALQASYAKPLPSQPTMPEERTNEEERKQRD